MTASRRCGRLPSVGAMNRFALTDMSARIVGAPMAGGPSTPALAAAVTNAGGLGILAAGMLSAEEMAEAIGSEIAASS